MITELDKRMKEALNLFRRANCCEATVLQAEAAFETLKGLSKAACVDIWKLKVKNANLTTKHIKLRDIKEKEIES
jgi:hypothetical protein